MESSYKKQPGAIGAATLGLLVLITMGIVAACQPGFMPSLKPTVESAQPLPLRTIADIPLTGSTSRFDYQSLDESRHQLYIAHMRANLVTVFDVQSQSVITDIQDVADVHGVLAIPELGKTYATATGSHEVVAIDEESLHIVSRIAGGTYPDGLAYASGEGKLFVSDEFGEAVVVIDVKSDEQIATIEAGGEVGNTQYDPVSRHILTNVQTRNQLVTIDPKTNEIIARMEIAGCAHPHGLHIDASARLAFIACEENATLVSVDLQTMQITGTYTTGDRPDVLAFDPGLHRLYIAAESGVLAIFEEHGNTVEQFAQGMLAPTAHTVAVDPETHRLYFPLENSSGHPVLRIMEPF
jgi:DNA-binding beta-propeller fold protein YncE